MIKQCRIVVLLLCASAPMHARVATQTSTQTSTQVSTQVSNQASTQASIRASPTTSPDTSPNTAAAAALTSDLESLIAQLGANDWSARQSAQDRLSTMGEPAAVRLRRVVDETADDEVRQNARAVLARIADDSLIAPSLITLHLKDVSPRDAFAQLAQQAGANFRAWPPSLWDLRAWPAVSLDVEAEPFWIALRKLCDATGIELRVWNDGLRLMQAAGLGAGASGPGWGGGRTTFCGAFLVTLRQCNRTQAIEYGSGMVSGPIHAVGADDAMHREFTLTFRGTAEPRLRVLRASYTAHLDEATDDAGNSLLVSSKDPAARDANNADPVAITASAAVAPDAGGNWEFTAALADPGRGKMLGTKLVSLRGGVNVVIRTRVETIEIPDVITAENVSRSSAAAGLKLTISRVKKLPDRFEIIAIVSRDRSLEAAGAVDPAARIADWERVQQSMSDIRLIDERGHALAAANLGSSGGDDSIDLRMTFARTDMLPPDPAASGAAPPATQPTANLPKLIWPITTETREIVIPFEFKDVNLP